ncbi:H+-exporting ATPase [Powellomyces hirtus]|uniref:Plasma membrane ATPase n=1 Tax=Powellomyces hirtus TaxID=109895 RepID=A0A507E047_9FUNG|nr:H+-exporting ATPase [Powellomyces hirtus]
MTTRGDQDIVLLQNQLPGTHSLPQDASTKRFPDFKDVGEGHCEHQVEMGDVVDAERERLLATPPDRGLTEKEVQERLQRFGENEIPERRASNLLKFLSYFSGPISFLLEIATIVSAVVGDWIDFGILLVVLVVNATIGYYEEAKAESALDALKNTLALKCRTLRNGQLRDIDAKELVPGDIIALRIGDIVPADARLLGLSATGDPTDSKLQIDQSALTGESLPASKGRGDIAYSSSTVKQGQMLAVVVKTALDTYIGRAANLISVTKDIGHFQKIINKIGNFLIIITVVSSINLRFIRNYLNHKHLKVLVVIILFVNLFSKHQGFLHALRSVLVLTVAAIPIGLPTVLSVTMAVGAKELAKEKVIVKRLTAIEEFASVRVLCSDKTGTLTMNRLSFDRPYLAYEGARPENPQGDGTAYTEQELLMTAYLASEVGTQDAIEVAVRKAAKDRVSALKDIGDADHRVPGYKVLEFIPFNPTSKYTSALVMDVTKGTTFRCIKGAPQVILDFVGGHAEAQHAINDFARRGLRALGVAKTTDVELTKFELVGMISLLDPPRPDSAATIQECERLGIAVKMITGDQAIIAKEVARRLGMQRTILDAHALVNPDVSETDLMHRVEKADGFAQVIPEHKYRVVELLQKKGYLVGMTGDGVNDAPALKRANVGIAVEGCTDAARSAADIVLLAAGLSTIVNGIETSRAIFQRMRSYALYRIASTIHFLIFFFITLLAFDFSLPDRLIILIAVLNDAATLVISVDNTRISRRPDKWRLGQLMFLSFVIGIILVAISFAHFFVARDVFNVDHATLQTIIYLNISSCPHFVIFSTRVPGWLWESRPSLVFIVAVGATQVFAMFMSIYGVSFFEAVPIGWGWGLSIIGISLLSMVLIDAVKVFGLRKWSFALTARLWPVPSRRAELAKRRAAERKAIALQRNCHKARIGGIAISTIAFWKRTAATHRASRDAADNRRQGSGAETVTLNMHGNA